MKTIVRRSLSILLVSVIFAFTFAMNVQAMTSVSPMASFFVSSLSFYNLDGDLMEIRDDGETYLVLYTANDLSSGGSLEVTPFVELNEGVEAEMIIMTNSLDGPTGREVYFDAQSEEIWKVTPALMTQSNLYLLIGATLNGTYLEEWFRISFSNSVAGSVDEGNEDTTNGGETNGEEVQEPEENCTDCSRLQNDLRVKVAEMEQKQQEIDDLLDQLEDADQALEDYDQALADAVNRSCEEVENYRNVDVQSGQAAGIIDGVHYYCRSERQVEDMLEAIETVRRETGGPTALKKAIQDFEAELDRADDQMDQIDEDIQGLRQRLSECIDLLEQAPACDGYLVDVPAVPERQEIDRERGEAVITTFTPVSDGVMASVSTNEERIMAIRRDFSQRFTTVMDRVETNRFSDYQDLNDDQKEAVEFLTNRIPLFTGEDNGARFGKDALSVRAVVAEIFYRLAELGQLENYDTDVSDVQRPADVPEGVWFEQSVLAAIKNGVFIPQNNRVRPADTVNWAELATIIRRFFLLNQVEVESSTYTNV